MRERAELLGGTIVFLRPEAGGTLVRLSVPLESEKWKVESENLKGEVHGET
jgi:nitrate/nitrite-specific signal transduction histidine kinase